MNIETIRARAEAFERRSRRQDMVGIAAFSVIVVGNAIAIAFESNVVEQLGDGLSIVAALYVLYRYWRAREASPQALGETPSIELYRNHVLRRQAMMSRFWTLVLLFAPGILLSTAGGLLVPKQPRQYVLIAVGFAGWLVVIEWLYRREARRLASDLESVEG